MRRSKTLLLTFAASVLTVSAALAGAKPPAKAVSADFYSGRWFEIARTPNSGQRDCQAPTTDFTTEGTAFKVRQTCHRGAPGGAEKVFATTGKILDGSQNSRFTMSFLGGLKKQEYWVLDSAADHSWAIMATPGGNYVWLISRTSTMPATTKASALERVKELGYVKLEYPEHGA